MSPPRPDHQPSIHSIIKLTNQYKHFIIQQHTDQSRTSRLGTHDPSLSCKIEIDGCGGLGRMESIFSRMRCSPPKAFMMDRKNGSFVWRTSTQLTSLGPPPGVAVAAGGGVSFRNSREDLTQPPTTTLCPIRPTPPSGRAEIVFKVTLLEYLERGNGAST